MEDSPPLSLNLGRGAIRSVVWATGFQPDYSWLHVPVLDRKGRVRHDGGVVPSPGMYLLGMPFLIRRKSALIDGAGADARELAEHLAGYLGRAPARTAADTSPDIETGRRSGIGTERAHEKV